MPALRFIKDAGTELRGLSRQVLGDARPVGGSLSRIHRDIRFSKDKSPYKTHIAIHFWHRSASDEMHTPGFYLHLGPGDNMAASGIWQPDPKSLNKIRRAIVARPRSWQAVLRGRPNFEGEALKRPPSGYDPNHPFIGDLKRKDFVATTSFTDAQVTDPRFMDGFLAACRFLNPLNRFLAEAVGLPW